MSDPPQIHMELSYQSPDLGRAERKQKSILRALRLLGWALLFLSVAVIAIPWASGALYGAWDMLEMAAIFGGAAFGCFTGIAAIRRRRIRTLKAAAIVTGIIAVGVGGLLIAGGVSALQAARAGNLPGIQAGMVVVALLIFLGPLTAALTALTIGLAEISRAYAKEQRESIGETQGGPMRPV